MSKRVLLADDSVTIQRVVEIILAEGDYELLVADNGDAAFDKMSTDRPDIVLADVYMPGKNGYELCSAIKQDASLVGIPVLLLSGTFEAFDESKALAAGADGWIAKPFESQALLEQLQELLARPAVAAIPAAGADVLSADEDTPAVAEPDMWADLEVDALGEEESEPLPAGAPAVETTEIDEVDLETDSLWEEEPQLEADEPSLDLSIEDESDIDEVDFTEISEADLDAEALTTSDELLDVSEEEVLFLDEGDLLIEEEAEDVSTEEEETFEFVTLEESAPETEQVGAQALEESSVLAEDQLEQADEVAEVVALDAAEVVTPAVAEEVEDIVPELEPAEQPPLAAEPEPLAVPEPEPVAAVADTAVSGLSFFRSGSLISKLAGEQEASPPAAEMPASAAEAQETVVSKEAVAERVQGLSEQELTAIVEQVAGKVIERLAATMLERIAWEVVPDLAESLIKEEISRITTATED